jgi:hypothetical protein
MTTVTRRLLIGGGIAFAAQPSFGQTSSPSPGQRAPFGLTWGLSAEDVRASGVVLPPTGTPSDYGLAYPAEGLKATLSDTEAVTLFFGHRNQLWRIFAVSRAMGPDPYGSRGVQRYQELAGLLTERYGKGRDVDERDSYSRKPEMYVYYLSQGNARRYTDFRGGRDGYPACLAR